MELPPSKSHESVNEAIGLLNTPNINDLFSKNR